MQSIFERPSNTDAREKASGHVTSPQSDNPAAAVIAIMEMPEVEMEL